MRAVSCTPAGWTARPGRGSPVDGCSRRSAVVQEIALDVVAVSGHEVPRPADPLAADIIPECPAAILSNQESMARGSSSTASSGPTTAKAG